MTINWWTLGLQTVNVVILIWLLGRFFWRPVAAMIEERRSTARQILSAAETKRSEATAAKAEIDKTRAGFAGERDAILAGAHEDAEKARTARLAEAAAEAAKLAASAKAAIESSAVADRKVWTDRAEHLAILIARRLAARLDGAAVRASFLDWLLKAIGDLPAATREAMRESGAAIDVSSASPLDPAEEERYRQVIGKALASSAPISFKTDPALIAGLELSGSRMVVTNSWRADLATILADVAHDD